MNLSPIIRQLTSADFQKMREAATTSRERFCLNMARANRDFEYHVDLPPEDEAKQQGLEDMAAWLADESRFPDE